MRTTVTLDEDVAAKLKSESRRSGKSFKETINEAIRRGLAAPKEPTARVRFKVQARSLGELRGGLDLDNVADLIERVEGLTNR
ncbi:MAG: CopG family transcriptional regulator [Pyrinomonadaceae bacterium]